MSILKFVVEGEGEELEERWQKLTPLRDPLLSAARNGQKDTLVYLIDKGLLLGPGHAEAAARSRDPAVMRLLIEAGTEPGSNLDFGPALVTAVEKENEQVGAYTFYDDELFQTWFNPVPPGALPFTSPATLIYQDQHPNTSRTATFRPFENAWGDLAENSVLRNAEWQWRVNVSQFYAPVNDSSSVPKTYDFSWSTGGNLSEALDNATSPLCFTHIGYDADWPVNITNALSDSSDASCVPALGQACVDTILSSIGTPSWEHGCNVLFPTFFTGFSIGFDPRKKTSQINSGDALFVNVTGPISTNETLHYDYFANQIQMLIVSVSLPSKNGGPNDPNATVLGKQVLCLRANDTKLPKVDVNKDGVALVGEVVLLSAGTSTRAAAAVGLLVYVGLVTLVVAIVLG
ncbi:hypothetical protein F5Y17DRAFT_463492 [Xylariaceae sp. FL0594]|nr:hypothetical protein F5Y17DRAFT_463492 [Xylariaceae sp. FL0594]